MQIVVALLLLLGSCIAQDTKCFKVIYQDGYRQPYNVASINSAGNFSSSAPLFCLSPNSVTISRGKGLLFYTCDSAYNTPQSLLVSTVDGQLVHQSNFSDPKAIYRNIFFDEGSSKLYGIESSLSSYTSYFVEISPSDATTTHLAPLPYRCYSGGSQIISPGVMWTSAQRFIIQVYCEYQWIRGATTYGPFFLDINMKNFTDMRVWLAPETDSNLFLASQSESMLTLNYAHSAFNGFTGKMVMSTSFLASQVSPIPYGNRTDIYVAIVYPQESYPTEGFFTADAFANSSDNRTTWYNFGAKQLNMIPFLNIPPKSLPYVNDNGEKHQLRSAFPVDCNKK